jgi:hypothetical protein
MKHLLNEARDEIVRLRRANEILGAKVEMIELFACVLHTTPARASVGMGEDVAWKLQQMVEDIEAGEKAAVTE